jgi:hypothetical protein
MDLISGACGIWSKQVVITPNGAQALAIRMRDANGYAPMIAAH